jgi:hypothetical protein
MCLFNSTADIAKRCNLYRQAPDMRYIALALSLACLISLEVLRVYFIMPFPGSQRAETISVAYWIDRNISWLRLLLLSVVLLAGIRWLRSRSDLGPKILFAAGMALYAVVAYLFNFRFLADRMFLQPGIVRFASGPYNSVKPDRLVLGVEMDGQSKAYPIQFIGYHHQVRDSIAGHPVMVTYCTVCRTGRVFRPVVNGKVEDFRLVGMDHFNAMFEDGTTKSWWRQVSGEAVVGPLKGTRLEEIPSEQMSLAAWMRLHPDSKVLQPDTAFEKNYAKLEGFDKGKAKDGLERRDTAAWNEKSWVVGITHGFHAKAYDWNAVLKSGFIQDSLPGLPVVLAIEPDSVSFHAWNRTVDGQVLSFRPTGSRNMIVDGQTGSMWDMDGLCTEGVMKGKRLQTVQAYQEFWHSWRTFHPNTSRY